MAENGALADAVEKRESAAVMAAAGRKGVLGVGLAGREVGAGVVEEGR